jgi:hypothetical protein
MTQWDQGWRNSSGEPGTELQPQRRNLPPRLVTVVSASCLGTILEMCKNVSPSYIQQSIFTYETISSFSNDKIH